MAINIQNIIDQITTKAAAADSSMNTDYLLSLSKAVLAMNQASGVIEYKQWEYLPAVDSSHLGSFAFIRSGIDLDSVYGDSYGAFFYAARVGSRDSAWDRIKTGVDSDAENPITPPSVQFPGSISGYATGGFTGPYHDIIEKFPFSADANATDVGDLTESRHGASGQSSTASGYTSGGFNPSFTGNTIDKFPFSADANATDVGDLLASQYFLTGQSSSTSGYASGGGGSTPTASNVIQKFPFAVDANAQTVGDLTQGRYGPAGQNSGEHGYTSGGSPVPLYGNVIDKFPFASDANATDVGDLTTNRRYVSGQSSLENGYTSGGLSPTDTIDKFPFSTDANATDVGNLTVGKYFSAGQSSTASGYRSGGNPTYSNIIDKFSFSSDGNATDVGDLTLGRRGLAGQQV
jgi:hypothetical protein